MGLVVEVGSCAHFVVILQSHLDLQDQPMEAVAARVQGTTEVEVAGNRILPQGQLRVELLPATDYELLTTGKSQAAGLVAIGEEHQERHEAAALQDRPTLSSVPLLQGAASTSSAMLTIVDVLGSPFEVLEVAQEEVEDGLMDQLLRAQACHVEHRDTQHGQLRPDCVHTLSVTLLHPQRT